MPDETTVTACRNSLTHTLLLDPSQPYLDHHRVGGVPLLGNVMAIDAIRSAAAQLTAVQGPLAVTDVRGPNPCFVPMPRSVYVETILNGDVVDCRIFDRKADGEEVYFTAKLVYWCPASDVLPVPAMPAGAVSGDEVYKLYFHGPAFRVIERAWLSGGVMYAALNAGLPPLFPNTSRPDPRPVELCLQTAGLWSVAVEGRMLIPEVIGRVDIIDLSGEISGGLIAAARPGTDGMDIVLTDQSGKVRATVAGYKSAPLPAPADEQALNRLRAWLCE